MKLLTPEEVKARLGIGIDLVLALIHSGELVAANVASGARRPRWRIDESDLQAFIDRRKKAQTSNRQLAAA